MSEIVVYGIPGSPYLRAVLLALHEKQAPYRLGAMGTNAFAPRTPEHLERHPFARIPMLQQGDFQLYETQAILRYLDAVLPGPALQPQDPRTAARMNQIAGIVDWYVFPFIAVGIGAERLFSQRFWQRPCDESNVARALPQARTCISELVHLMGDGEFVAGPALTIADLMLLPHMLYFSMTPEGQTLLADTPLAAWLTRMRARESVRATEVERLLAAA
jgi:glutathione S-transferase